MPVNPPAVLRHLDYSGRAKEKPYTAKGSGGAKFKRFERQDRLAHAGKLRGDLAQAQLESERLKTSQELAGYEEDAGITLVIRSAPGHPLKLESFDSPSRGFTLESVRHEEAEDVMVATVFVKHGKLSHLSKSVEDYSCMKSRTDKTGKVIAADKADLIANIESIGIAAIEAFWTSKHPLPDLDVATWWEVWVRVGSESQRSRHESAVESEAERLACVSGGNVWLQNRSEYPAKNELTSLEDPAQSWNVLTVGACTAMEVVTDHNGDIVPDAVCIAPRGGLSPHSATSCLWTSKESRHWPLKPDVVFEGGNVAADANGNREERDSLCLLTTNSDIQQRLFTSFCMTSAATALAAKMGAHIQAEYPEFWPETVRALMVHSAEWTPEMLRDAKKGNKGHVAHILRRFGHGQPNLARALASARSRATLICQDSLQPFEKTDGSPRTKDMMLYRLPWPKPLLQANSAVNVKLRITLSYFIEPNPGSRMVNSKYRYAGCNLRFLVRTATEKSVDNFIARVSNAISDDERDSYEKPDDTTDGWTLGDDLRCRGSIHSDTWTGTAAQLAEMEHLIVFPVNGWWRLRTQHKKYNNRIRYSLVVSLETVGTDLDIFTPIKAAVDVPISV